MRISSLLCTVLFTCVSFLQAQEPATDLEKLRTEANAAVQNGNFTVAAAAWKKLTDGNPKDAEAWHMLGYSLHAAGKLDEALAAHQKAAEFPATAAPGTYNIACVHALKGETDLAFTWLEKAIAVGFNDIDQLRNDTDFASIRKDPRMAKIEAAVQAKAGAGRLQVYEQNVARKNARAAWFGRGGSPAQIAIDYSPVPWQEKYEQVVTSGSQKGKKWRLGSDFWTRLDTSIDLQFGATTVPAGYYYLTLEQRDAESFVLAVHDAAAVKKQKLDAYQAQRLQGGIEVPMVHGKAESMAKELEIGVLMQGSSTNGTLRIQFGAHALTAPFTIQID